MIRLVFIGFMNEIIHEMINIDKCYYMKTINSSAEGYYYSCRFSCAGQCVLELQALSYQSPQIRGQVDAELKNFAKHLRKTHIHKQQAKQYLLLKSPVLVHLCELKIPIKTNSTC